MAEATGQTVPAEGRSLWGSVKPYLEKESLAAFFVGVSSGFPYAMIGAHAAGTGRHREVDHHRLHARVPGL